ncbi:hypothetical protein ACEPAI_5813 [Sanghuangporus weigelae]
MSPAVVVSQSSPSTSKDLAKPTHRSESAKVQPRAHKTRVNKRRARARRGVESDDEIERETMSDVSDTDDDLTPSDSASDSEAESESESLAMHNGRHRAADTPSTTQSPPPGEIAGSSTKSDLEAVDASQSPPRSAPAFFNAGNDWSDMVTAENVNGAAPLPVIDFSELAAGEPPHLTPQDTEDVKGEDTSTRHGTEQPQRGGSPSSRGVGGRSARHAYQQRLQSDPSFVPTVGEFWSHDDRLMQKDLRSLSDWWRGRWQGRGRGRGGFIGRVLRGRGRGGFSGASRPVVSNGSEDELHNPGEDALQPDHTVPPVEKPWTHDGFEELRAKEEERRAVQKRAVKPRPGTRGMANGTPASPSRGGFVPRGRGSFRAASSPTPSRMSYIQRLRSQPDRPWFTMKPEHVWTKQFEGFLFSEPSLKSKHGKPASYRVHLPGKDTEIIRAPAPEHASEDASELRSQPPSEMTAFTDAGSRMIVVKLPIGDDVFVSEESVKLPESITTAEDLPVETSIPGSSLQFSTIEQTEGTYVRPVQSEHDLVPAQSLGQGDVTATPALTRDNSLSEKSFADLNGVSMEAEQSDLETVKHAPEAIPVIPVPIPPPPIQTSFPTPLQPTPSYSPAPYGYPALPPGIAVNQQGFTYEVASGRPVYLHSTPPPQIPMYNPRPIPFIPGHMHHHSLSGDFIPGPSTPPINGFIDPSTGQPFFQLPPQSSSRIEIRAPSDANDGQALVKRDRRPSNLRSVTMAEQNGEAGQNSETNQEQQQSSSFTGLSAYAEYPPAPEYYQPGMIGGMASQPPYQPSEGAASMSPGSEVPPQSQQPSIMGYPPYQHQYYYPEQYYPYIEMPQQPGQYDPYNTDPRQQPPVYY